MKKVARNKKRESAKIHEAETTQIVSLDDVYDGKVSAGMSDKKKKKMKTKKRNKESTKEDGVRDDSNQESYNPDGVKKRKQVARKMEREIAELPEAETTETVSRVDVCEEEGKNSSASLSQRVSALEKAITHQSFMLSECIDDMKASLSLHGKLVEVLRSQRIVASAVPPPPPVQVPSFTEQDRDMLKLAVTLMITQGLTVTDLNQTLLRIVSRLSSFTAANPEGENAAASVAAAAATAEPVFTADSSSTLINLDEDEEEEEEAEVEAETDAEG